MEVWDCCNVCGHAFFCGVFGQKERDKEKNDEIRKKYLHFRLKISH